LEIEHFVLVVVVVLALGIRERKRGRRRMKPGSAGACLAKALAKADLANNLLSVPPSLTVTTEHNRTRLRFNGQ
jgi:hypothetical protein